MVDYKKPNLGGSRLGHDGVCATAAKSLLSLGHPWRVQVTCYARVIPDREALRASTRRVSSPAAISFITFASCYQI